MNEFLVALVVVLVLVVMQQRAKLAVQFTSRSVDAIDQLVKPVASKLAEVDQKLAAFDKAREGTEKTLTAHMEQLRRNNEQLRDGTIALTRALRQPQGRGRWGEMQLRSVVELAGLSEATRDFTTQRSVTGDDDRRLRPDMVVNLPNGRCVVIDAKAPLDAYLDAVEAADDDEALPHLQRHAEQVRTHVSQLSKKDYSSYLDGALPEMVVLFLPAEHLFAAAVQQRPQLLEEAFGKRIVIASPTTLLTLLHAVAMGWKEERLAEGAAQIAELGRELHKRVATMAEHFDKVGRGLETAMRAYNQAVGSLETQVLPQARRFEQLDVASTKDVPELEERTVEVRQLQARELVAQLEEVSPDSQITSTIAG